MHDNININYTVMGNTHVIKIDQTVHNNLEHINYQNFKVDIFLEYNH